MVGPSLDAPGGISSVARIYRDFGFFSSRNVCYLSSYVRPGLTTQLRVMTHALLSFLGMLVRSKVSLLHVHSAVLGSFWRKSIFCALARAFGVPYIFHIHSGYFPVFVRDDCGPLARWWVRYTLRHARCVIALTSSWRAALEELAPGLRVEVLGNPVAVPDILPVRHEKQLMHVLFLGRLRDYKGVFDLVMAIPRVLESVPEAMFTIAGDGDKDAVARQVNALGVQNAVTLPGWVDGIAKDALLAAADVLVLPSYIEGLPMCILEAMAIGVPVVSTAVGGIPEALENGACGALINPGDVEAMAAAIVTFLLDRETTEHVCKRAFERAKEVYSAPVIIHALAELYGKIIIFQETMDY